MTFVEMQSGDDTGFLGYVEAVVGRIATLNVAGIYITRIDGWFGERWVGFSGKVLGAAGVHFRQDLDIPPFVPNRVVSSIFLKRESEGYEPTDPPVTLHIKQHSEANLAARSPRSYQETPWSGSAAIATVMDAGP